MKLQVSNPARNSLLAIADVADSAMTRRVGLLGRVSFAPGEGLLITPCNSIHTYGLRFPIDVAFLGPNAEVLGLLRSVMPNGTALHDNASSVLELPAGALGDTQEGDILEMAPLNLAFVPAQEGGGLVPGCIGILDLAEQYGLVQPGTTVAVSQLVDHANRVKQRLQGVMPR